MALFFDRDATIWSIFRSFCWPSSWSAPWRCSAFSRALITVVFIGASWRIFTTRLMVERIRTSTHCTRSSCAVAPAQWNWTLPTSRLCLSRSTECSHNSLTAAVSNRRSTAVPSTSISYLATCRTSKEWKSSTGSPCRFWWSHWFGRFSWSSLIKSIPTPCSHRYPQMEKKEGDHDDHDYHWLQPNHLFDYLKSVTYRF